MINKDVIMIAEVFRDLEIYKISSHPVESKSCQSTGNTIISQFVYSCQYLYKKNYALQISLHLHFCMYSSFLLF